jgi:uncharacterized protein involved in response to NO
VNRLAILAAAPHRAFFLYAVQSAALAAGGAAILGTAPLHAMTIGYFSAMAVAMVSRVSLGHAGHALVADRWTWAAFWGMLATAAARVAAELAQGSPALWPPAILASGLGFLVFFGMWAARYIPVYLRPRADGRAGLGLLRRLSATFPCRSDGLSFAARTSRGRDPKRRRR